MYGLDGGFEYFASHLSSELVQIILWQLCSVLAPLLLTRAASTCTYSVCHVNPSYTVPLLSRGYPESCSCKETGVTASECSLFSCDCNCDITVGQCDYHCCCDPDCTAEQVCGSLLND